MLRICIGGYQASSDPDHPMKKTYETHNRKTEIYGRHPIHAQESTYKNGIHEGGQILCHGDHQHRKKEFPVLICYEMIIYPVLIYMF